eukprot:comp19742_c0_seq2/m.38033 comp19742_c0_seq2/g.38033  ORF comp19742_c0_seq2/g.38033 comp19742_c0_seq2/m.38033 type:complete len:200 (+) comp19742_c0_seq2:110-709(+)
MRRQSQNCAAGNHRVPKHCNRRTHRKRHGFYIPRVCAARFPPAAHTLLHPAHGNRTSHSRQCIGFHDRLPAVPGLAHHVGQALSLCDLRYAFTKIPRSSCFLNAEKHAKYIGDWDLRQCLPNQARASKLHIPAGFKTWRNIKREFGSFYGTPQPRGMLDMLGTLRLQLEGRHHSGLDDCKNIARVLMKMIEDGYRTSLE